MGDAVATPCNCALKNAFRLHGRKSLNGRRMQRARCSIALEDSGDIPDFGICYSLYQAFVVSPVASGSA